MSTFDGEVSKWKATTNPALILAGALFITLSKIVTSILCGAGAWKMWSARTADAADFANAKTLALTGCAVALFMLFTGFVVVGEGWFEFWRSFTMSSAGETAFRYGGMIALIALFVGAREEIAVGPRAGR